MTIRVTQTCNKCKKERDISRTTISNGRLQGGWREIDDKDVCPDCIKAFLGEVS